MPERKMNRGAQEINRIKPRPRRRGDETGRESTRGRGPRNVRVVKQHGHGLLVFPAGINVHARGHGRLMSALVAAGWPQVQPRCRITRMRGATELSTDRMMTEGAAIHICR